MHTAESIHHPFFHMVRTIASIAGVWLLASSGYLFFFVGDGASVVTYHLYPLRTAAYFGLWIAIAGIAFWPMLRSVKVRRSDIWMYAFFTAAMTGVWWLYVYHLPLSAPTLPLSAGDIALLKGHPITGSSGYFFSKMFEILLQQILVIALIEILAQRYRDIGVISVLYALGFGLAHFLLFFQNTNPLFADVYVIAAMCSGFVMPYLILRVSNGFLWTYLLHWGFYVALALVLS